MKSILNDVIIKFSEYFITIITTFYFYSKKLFTNLNNPNVGSFKFYVLILELKIFNTRTKKKFDNSPIKYKKKL